MPMSEFDSAFEKIGALVQDFQRNESHYKSPNYSESQARKDFIDKFWIALGWDVNHDRETNPYEQEVKVERGVTMGGGQRRADYAFYLAPNFRDVRFFVEAKKPFVEIGTSESYFQLIRYGWNSETPLAVLTDFEQFHVLDCRYRPDLETALNRSLSKYRYTDYVLPDKFSEIYWLFSREAVAAGSLEKRAAELPKPRGKSAKLGLVSGGYQSIDESFLAELDEYRNSLARNFKNHNPDLDSETLTELAQRTLDRLVFLRFLEDKGIEPQRIMEHFRGWDDFVAASRRLDGIYNGVVYKRHGLLDGESFRVDDNAFADICERLSHLNSPYDFNAIPIHILGSIYERFLGKVIVATDKRAKVEEKPEVRKAGGVYYTPEYIVRYIVENTVGKLIAGKTPAQIADMRFADIACGSGSFLLGVFDLLLTYHGHYYNDNPGKAKKGDCIRRDGTLFLSLQKKREILLNNIYGVDIDAQAVEVCQLSLYLKLLQEETESSAHQYRLDFEHEARMKQLLPDLKKNIRWGNSLIGTDILDGQLFPQDEELKLRPMDFDSAFPEIMKRGGFDAIVGNPPYVRQEGLKDTKDYLEKHFESFSGTADLYTYFMERAVKLLRQGGRFSYIVSSSFLRATYAEALRETLKKYASVLRLVDFGGHAVFADAKDTYVCIPIFSKVAQPHHIEIAKVFSIKSDDVENEMRKVDFTIPHERFGREAWSLKSDEETALFTKILATGKPLGEYVGGNFFRGITSGFNEAFIINTDMREQLIAKDKKCAEIIHPVRGGEDIRAYHILPSDDFIIFTRRGISLEDYPAIRQHLEQYRADLTPRNSGFSKRGRKPGTYKWYEIQDDTAYYNIFEQPKIVFPDICKNPRFCYDDSGLYLTNTAYALGTGDKYLLGILNSRVFWFAISNISIPFGVRAGAFRYRLIYQYMEKVPIREINFSDATDKKIHDEMVAKVEAMLTAKKQLAQAKTDKDKTYYENKCASLDRQIDRLVYDLYGLTEEEIGVVEGSNTNT